MIANNQPIPVAAGRKPEDAKLLTLLMLDLIRQKDALADVCAHLQVACDLIANPVGKFYLRDVATDIRAMGRRLEPVRCYAWQQIKEMNNEGRDG